MSALIGRRAALRWVHLVLGGALLMPYWMLSLVLLSSQTGDRSPQENVLLQFAALALALPMAAVTALVPMVRVLESTAARALGLGGATELATTPSQSWAARRRTAAWYVQHLLLGGIVAGVSLSVPPAVVTVLFFPSERLLDLWFGGARIPLPLLALGLAVLPVLGNAAAGAWLARTAPALLGPTPAEKLAAAERRSLELAQRNRLARELHDSVGHALSAVGIQAAAAGRVLASSPEFVAEALAAIEETARIAVAELDTVLGLLREDQPADPATGPTLAELDTLLRQLELAGVPVETRSGPGLTALPGEVSRAAYRIVQEGLTNVLRHAGQVPAALRLELTGGVLELELSNPVGADRPSRPGGGRGLRGMAERAAVLNGECQAGPTGDGRWRLAARLPIEGEQQS
ncbi:signal transduction histidine kinase [Kitasatospora gansuensis]|uniref:histidine kinase n=1 Tax=Kitasatospora gansuensis TaxID=258050 RepID=A0A7W7SHT4_9ACTN|nr:histidine kinase [Kitasatospora gansuensis]MBB4950317.1 signal transduction histidine kinase [Kitasatospora gansuensis]